MNEAPITPGPQETDEPAELPPAWEFITFRGAARFAHASLGRLLLVQVLVALLACFSIMLLVGRNIAPAVTEAIHKLPEDASLHDGTLTNVPSILLGKTRLLALVAKQDDTDDFGENAEIQLEFGATTLDAVGLLGTLSLPYPKNLTVSLARSVAEPWWGAWRPVLVTVCGLLALPVLVLNWWILALLYFPVARLMAFFADRSLSWPQAWRLSAAAQLTGALVATLAILLLSLEAIDLIRFAFFYGTHFLVGWVYVLAAPFFLPATAPTAGSNPFAGPGPAPIPVPETSN